MAREIRIVVTDNNDRISVVNGNIHILCGDAAMITNYDAASKVEKECAIKPEEKVPAGISEEVEEMKQRDFDRAVLFLMNCSAEDYIELVRYAKAHHNTFWHCVSEVRDVINADDAYCSALINLTRPWGKKLEDKAFHMLSLLDTGHDQEFIKFWNALKVING